MHPDRSTTAAPRWTEVTASPFVHEAEGLNRIRDLLPTAGPFRAWSNFEFRDDQGKWHEVDLLVLGRRRLHLVELKYYSGTINGDDYRWLRDGHRAEDSPLKLARRKAQRLAGKLRDELYRWATEEGRRVADARDLIPFVQEAVYLHHPQTRCVLAPASRIDLFGLDGMEAESGLPGISERLLEPVTAHQSVSSESDDVVATLMARIGVVQRRQREVGSWMIDDAPVAEGRDWQDWPASHLVAGKDRARIRFHVTRLGAPKEEQRRVRQVAEHEYRIMSRLTHDGLLRPRDIVDNELGVGLVYPDDQAYQRLDLWLAEQTGAVSAADQLAIVRQVAETLLYAHSNGVVHRGLTPAAVRVSRRADGRVRVLVGDWQTAGRLGGRAGSTTPSAGVTDLLDDSEAVELDGDQATVDQEHVDIDRRQAEAFQAPEGVWRAESDRVCLDIFALGALTYFVVTGRSPASDRHALRARLLQDDGLDLAADLPQVPSPLRAAVLEATRPTVTKRLRDVRSFLEPLAAAERVVSSPDDDVSQDPLQAVPGAIIAGRFQLERRLGAGSTAVALRVKDLAAKEGPDSVRVLKVAIDDSAARRLTAEAEVLAQLNSPRLVRLVEDPIEIGGRRTLVLESAGDETLAEALRARRRLSLDLLERWGQDLLEALIALERAGVDHRDIKPANLGVREGRGDRVKHLVLFDFSLSRAGLAATRAGTPPYLDPFLEMPGRKGYDTAAERYSVGAVLFEMASGTTPVYGDGLSDPTVVADDARVTEDMFDEAVAPALVPFFRRALARNAGARFHTAGEMLASWTAAIKPVPRTAAADAADLADAAQPSTPLAEAGLSPRALSAVEPLGVITVADLVAVDPVRLSRLGGVAEATRVELRDLSRLWRERFGAAIAGRRRDGDQASGSTDAGLPTPAAAADLLLARAGDASAQGRRRLARLILGLDPGAHAFASQLELANVLGVTRARVAQLVGGLQNAWSQASECRQLLKAVASIARAALIDLGGVATAEELSSALLAALAPVDQVADRKSAGRIAAGLLRMALDRSSALNRTQAEADPFYARRRDGRIAILATDPALLDAADALGEAADDLVSQVTPTEGIVPARRASAHLREALARVTSGVVIRVDDARLVRLGAALATKAALSGAGDLHYRDLSPVVAVSIALRGVGATERIRVQEIKDRVRARFPALPPLPDRPGLDQLVQDAGLGLVYDEAEQAYRGRTVVVGTAGLESRLPTVHPSLAPTVAVGGHIAERLRESKSKRSFLALGVEARRIPRTLEVLRHDFDAEVLDLTRTLMDAIRVVAAAAQPPIPWDAVRAADAAMPESREAIGLARLIALAIPNVAASVEAVLGGAARGAKPLILTEAAPLARYGHLGMLSRWSDLASPRAEATWLLVPQLLGNQGAIIDGRPIPLAAPGQFLRLDAEWIDAHASAGRAVEAMPS